MGCTPSKIPNTIVVARSAANDRIPLRDPVDVTSMPISGTGSSQSKSDSTPSSEIKINIEKDLSLESSMVSRISEISSTESTRSWDSGVYELEDEYSHVITEYSVPDQVRMVELDFKPKESLDLVIEGKACPRKLSPKDRDRFEQQCILEMLREEGLIVWPEAKSTGGLRFDLVSAENVNSGVNGSRGLRRLPPLHLREKHKKRLKKELTYDDIQKKLSQAELRRKKQEEERISKLSQKTRSASVQKMIEDSKQRLEEKLEAKSRSREKHLLEIQEKLKAKELHAEKVRKRKQMLTNTDIIH